MPGRKLTQRGIKPVFPAPSQIILGPQANRQQGGTTALEHHDLAYNQPCGLAARRPTCLNRPPLTGLFRKSVEFLPTPIGVGKLPFELLQPGRFLGDSLRRLTIVVRLRH